MEKAAPLPQATVFVAKESSPWIERDLISALGEDRPHVAAPLAMITGEQIVGGGAASLHEFFEGPQEGGLVIEEVGVAAGFQSVGGYIEHRACDVEHGSLAKTCLQAKPGNLVAELLALFGRPILDEVIRGVEA